MQSKGRARDDTRIELAHFLDLDREPAAAFGRNFGVRGHQRTARSNVDGVTGDEFAAELESRGKIGRQAVVLTSVADFGLTQEDRKRERSLFTSLVVDLPD